MKNEFETPDAYVAMSLDLVGFTHIKTHVDQFDDIELSWPNYLRRFIEAVLTISRRVIEQTCVEFNRSLGNAGALEDRLGIWKTIGDEVVLKVEVRDLAECELATLAFINAARAVAEFLSRGGFMNLGGQPGGDVKGAIWSFVIGADNVEIRLGAINAGEETKPTLQTIDFAGPAIDCGFRLAGSANPSRLLVSNELVLQLATGLLRANENTIERHRLLLLPKLYGGQRRELKGVLFSTPYPLWEIHIIEPESLWEKREIQFSEMTWLEAAELSNDFLKLVEGSWHEQLAFSQQDAQPNHSTRFDGLNRLRTDEGYDLEETESDFSEELDAFTKEFLSG